MRIHLPSTIQAPLLNAIGRLELTFDPRIGINKVKRYGWEWKRDSHYAFMIVLALLSLFVMAAPILFKLFLVGIYTLALLVPFTSQFVLPATPIFSWLLLFFSAQFIPTAYRPSIWVSVLPTLESVLYGANISDLLTRYTNPVLDIIAWLPYGVAHFVIPFVVAACLFVFAPPGAVKFWGAAFGFLNVVGVMIQIGFPSAPPWYELQHGLIPANYAMGGNPGGLRRIDAIFGGNGYTTTFTNAPVPFGAFPSLHAGCSTMEALFLSHFFPKGRPFYWCYVLVLYWSTMYLTHHYLIDVVAGGALACAYFYYYLSKAPDELRHPHLASSIIYNNANNIPMDPESNLGLGVPKGGSGGNGYAGWDELDDEDFDDEFGTGGGRDGDIGVGGTQAPTMSRGSFGGNAV